MANHALLNNIEHQDLKIITDRSIALGDNLWYSPTFLGEFYQVQVDYPIVLNFDEQAQQYTPVALFGFKDKENLFLSDKGWEADYIPASVRRLPFYIGWQQASTESEKQRVITIDLDSPRVNQLEGQSLFLPLGGNSEYLENMANTLESLHQGLEQNSQFIAVLNALELIEPATFEITLSDDSTNQLHGFYVINEDKLHQLDTKQVFALHQNGYLAAIYFMIASLANIQSLVNKKNNTL